MALVASPQVVPAEVLLGSRAGDWLTPMDGRGKAAEAVYLQRWTVKTF